MHFETKLIKILHSPLFPSSRPKSDRHEILCANTGHKTVFLSSSEFPYMLWQVGRAVTINIKTPYYLGHVERYFNQILCVDVGRHPTLLFMHLTTSVKCNIATATIFNFWSKSHIYGKIKTYKVNQYCKSFDAKSCDVQLRYLVNIDFVYELNVPIIPILGWVGIFKPNWWNFIISKQHILSLQNMLSKNGSLDSLHLWSRISICTVFILLYCIYFSFWHLI